MRTRFDSAYIRSELERIGEPLDVPLTVFLIGGGAMAFRDLKNTTKDIDLVVASGADLGQLQATLLECGYEIVRAPDEEYEALDAQRILENDDGCRIDLFNRQVIHKLMLSDGIRQRSDPHLAPGNLTVALVSAEDIFLFKADAGRVDDIRPPRQEVKGGRTEYPINSDRIDGPPTGIAAIPQAEFHAPIRTFRERVLEAVPDLHGIVVFGSVARGEADRQSDIDVFLNVASAPPTEARRDVADIVAAIEAETFDGHRYGFDQHVESATETREYGARIVNIMTEGIPIYTTDIRRTRSYANIINLY